MSRSSGGEGWSRLDEAEERALLIEEARDCTKQIVAIVGIIIGVVSLTLMPAAHRYLVFIRHANSASSAVMGFLGLLVAAGAGYAAWTIIMSGVNIVPFTFDGNSGIRISMARLRGKLQSAYLARAVATIALFLWPVMLIVVYLMTLQACAAAKC
jgi:hypothetical protein